MFNTDLKVNWTGIHLRITFVCVHDWTLMGAKTQQLLPTPLFNFHKFTSSSFSKTAVLLVVKCHY